VPPRVNSTHSMRSTQCVPPRFLQVASIWIAPASLVLVPAPDSTAYWPQWLLLQDSLICRAEHALLLQYECHAADVNPCLSVLLLATVCITTRLCSFRILTCLSPCALEPPLNLLLQHSVQTSCACFSVNNFLEALLPQHLLLIGTTNNASGVMFPICWPCVHPVDQLSSAYEFSCGAMPQL
jgi:hypothetical protein